MTTWNDLETGAPPIAAAGRRLLERSGAGEGLLATVRADSPPRIHPVNVGIVDGHMLTFVIVGSAKAGDLAADGRYALHAHQDPAVPHEFQVRGRAVEIDDADRRASAAAVWPFAIDDGYTL
jgi:Pyridoxamine 5'-phosphate oxidase